MCEPTTAMLVLTAASTAMGVYGQYEQANAQAKGIERSARIYNDTLQQQYSQIQQQGTDQVSEATRKAMIEQARMRVAAGESGIYGNSVNELYGNSEFNVAEAIAGIQKNTRNTKDQAYLGGLGGTAQLQDRANRIQQPNWIGAGLQIASDTAGKWDKLKAEWSPALVEERSFN